MPTSNDINTLRKSVGKSRGSEQTTSLARKPHGAAPERLIRLSAVLAPTGPIPMSKSAWWQGVRESRLPQPVTLGPKTKAWRASDIERLVTHGLKAFEGR